jgi:hypothetical protein
LLWENFWSCKGSENPVRCRNPKWRRAPMPYCKRWKFLPQRHGLTFVFGQGQTWPDVQCGGSCRLHVMPYVVCVAEFEKVGWPPQKFRWHGHQVGSTWVWTWKMETRWRALLVGWDFFRFWLGCQQKP